MEDLRESRTKSRKKREGIVSNKVQNQHIYKYRISVTSLKFKMLSKIIRNLVREHTMPVAFPCFPVVSAGVISDCSSLQTLFVV